MGHLAFFASLLSIVAPGPLPRIRAVRTALPPQVDGRLDEGAWQLAAPSDDFTQKFPNEGRPPTERTTVRVMYDDGAVYIGVQCDQLNAPMRRRLTRRDREAEDGGGQGGGGRVNPGTTDRITVHIGSRRDGATAFAFGINAAGVLSDGIHFDDVGFTSRWDANWEGRTAVTDLGWSAELRIPLRALRFDSEPAQDWGFNVRRFIAARQEVDEWAFSPATEPRVVSQFGQLESLDDLPSPKSLELSPFVVGETSRRSVPAPTTDPWAARWSAGLDARLHPSQSTTLSATINPDFGQVEADQVILNLTTYETFLPEKRPFFLEGLEFFQTPKDLLYTRRIGGAPGSPALPDGEAAIGVLRPSPILGAIKLTGQPLRGLSVGILSVLTDDNLVTTVDQAAANGTPPGPQQQRLAAPMALSSAVRVKIDVGKSAQVGLIATGVNRTEDRDLAATPTGTLCPSGALIAAGGDCFRDAYVGGIDGRWRSGAGQYYATGQAIASRIVGGPPRTMADGTVVKSGDSDVSGILHLGKDGGRWLVNSVLNYTGRRMDYNDLGYMREQNNAWAVLNTAYRTSTPWWGTRETRTGLWGKEAADVDGAILTRDIGAYSSLTLKNFWRVGGEVSLRPRFFSEREIAGSAVRFERSPGTHYEVNLRSPGSKPIIASLGFAFADKIEGRELGADAGIFLRAFPQLELDLLSTITRVDGERRYVSAETLGTSTQYLFGRLAATGVSTTLRATYSLSPSLTLQAYGQLFLASRRYGDFATFTAAAANPVIGLGSVTPAAAPIDSPDRQDAALNATIVLRWEYMLGSTLYAVYSRSQVPTAALLPGATAGLDIGSLRRAPAVDAFMLKLSYWWG